VAILNRLVNALTNYKAGSSVFSMLTNLVGKQIAIIEVDKIGFVKNAMKMMDVYVSLAPTAFETLSELSIPEETTEVFHPHKDFENRSIPALLLQLGQILQKRIHEQWQVDLALLKRTSRSEFDAFIPAVSEHLAARLNRCDFLMRRLNMTPLEPVDAQIMALLFVVRLASISDRMTPKCVAAGIEGDFEARIRVIRRIRNGILVRSGIIQDPLQSGLLLDEEVFDDLLELDGEDN
jgi:hypothetical protein